MNFDFFLFFTITLGVILVQQGKGALSISDFLTITEDVIFSVLG